ncbi:PorP/SprF family type IX secretion system membrane protein [Chitinophaga barathri]|nr:PorP/SprF family type IX secretion system membrane protein [Chitinophaga barathri]
MKRYIWGFMLCLLAQQAGAQTWGNTSTQVAPLGTQYFQNQYLGNPSFAGVDTGLHLNGAYRRQWNDVPGAPVAMAFTADYLVGKRVGAGLNIFRDEAGLITRTRVSVTYAYHLPLSLSGRQKLHFGLSAGLRNDRLDLSKLNGDATDPSLNLFNRRDNYFDVDFGVAYTDGHLNIQAALPNVVGYFQSDNKDIANSSTWFTAVSYRVDVGEGFTSIEPKVCFRAVRGFDNIFDFGANIALLNNWVNVFGMYHTSQNFTVGAGFSYRTRFGLQLIYSTQTAGLKNYLGDNFTLGLTVNLFDGK